MAHFSLYITILLVVISLTACGKVSYKGDADNKKKEVATTPVTTEANAKGEGAPPEAAPPPTATPGENPPAVETPAAPPAEPATMDEIAKLLEGTPDSQALLECFAEWGTHPFSADDIKQRRTMTFDRLSNAVTDQEQTQQPVLTLITVTSR